MIRLLFDGRRITETDTAAELDLEDGDALEVLLERTSYPIPPSPSVSIPRANFTCRGWWMLSKMSGSSDRCHEDKVDIMFRCKITR